MSSDPSIDDLREQLNEALEQQTATSEVLRVISSSAGDLEQVFLSMLENATRICEASFGNLFRFDGEMFRLAATIGAPQAYKEFLRQRGPFLPEPGIPLDRVLETKKVVHVRDYAAEPFVGPPARLGGARSTIVVPMLKNNNLVGAIVIYRKEVRSFSEKQISLVQHFAAQAVIAIENTRLLNELRESLEQQTATSEVMKVINSSPGDLAPVFDAILEKTHALCGLAYGALVLREGETFRAVAIHSYSGPFAEQLRQGYRGVDNPLVRPLIDGERFVHIPNLAQIDHPMVRASVENVGIRTGLYLPLRKDGVLLGMISCCRREIRPFSDEEIALLENFAAQAVIAIENARLLSELRESLQQQTATSDVLSVISSSRGELEHVFDAMLESAVRLCEAKFGVIFSFEKDQAAIVAMLNVPAALEEFNQRRGRQPPLPGTALDKMWRTKKIDHTIDDLESPLPSPPTKLAGARTHLAVPLLKDGEVVGAIVIYRQEVHPFADKQIELVQSFASQAVVAIENARLLNELRERTEQLQVQSQEVIKLNQQLEGRVAEQVGEIERMGRLRRFLPPQVADLIVSQAAEKQLESHRREITALFCDLRGFTGFSESSDPEDVMALLREYHSAIGAIIHKHGGTLERFVGDGIMVIFNDPVPVPNPALQAVQMALEMREAISALMEKWQQLGHDLSFGMGISHGYATLGTIGFEGRFDYAAIGTVSNVASRLCDEAKPGQILASPRVALAVKDEIALEPVGELTLKGIRRPIMVQNIVGVASSN